jgi:TonB family protein
MKQCAILVAVVALWLQPVAASDDSGKQQEAIKKIEQAVAKTNIFDLPSFQMKANVEVQNQGKGSYQLLWNGPEQWREEIRLSGYSEVQIGGKGTVWIQRSTDFLPLRIYDLHAALGFGSGVAGSGSGPTGSLVQSSLTQKDKIKKIHERKKHGEMESCVEYEDEVKRLSEICVNESTGTLVRGSSYVNSSYVGNDLQLVGGGKLYPRFLGFVENGTTVAKATVTEFTTSGQFPPNSFVPPAGVSPQAGCMNPTPFRLIKRVTPQYPKSARERRIQGLVAIDVWIGLDGIPRIGKVVEHVSPELEQSSASAIQEWRYEPATCNGSPIGIQTVLRFSYTLN